jgi:hypothetical protein
VCIHRQSEYPRALEAYSENLELQRALLKNRKFIGRNFERRKGVSRNIGNALHDISLTNK